MFLLGSPLEVDGGVLWLLEGFEDLGVSTSVLDFLDMFVSSLDDRLRFLFSLFFTGGISLKKVALCLCPHRLAYMAALMIRCFVSDESTVTLIGGASSQLEVCEVLLAGRAPTMWCGSMSIPWRPILSFLSFLKSWYSALS